MPTARELLDLARGHIGEPYVLGAKVPKGNPAWRGPWDCAEFTSWCAFQLTGALFGCRPRKGNPDTADAYTGFWAEDAKKVGESIAVGQAVATPGAFLLRIPKDGTIGHVVISAGGGKTVEAHSSKRGVIEGTADGRLWHIGVLVPGIDVTVPEVATPPERAGLVLRVKSPPMKGDLVKDVQRALTAAGFSSGPIDGVYGAQTAAAVQAFQMAKGLVPDGEVGKTTAKRLGVGWY